MSLNNKKIIVSGGTRGIGRALVIELVKHGAYVAFTYINSDSQAESLIRACCSDRVIAKKVDIRDQSSVKNMLSELYRQWGELEIIINNAGIREDKGLMFMSAKNWHNVIDTNLNGVFNLTQAALFYLLKKKKGRIINISSLSGITGVKGQTNYSSSKAGIIGFTRALAKEVAHVGISVNVIAPGGVDTDMVKDMDPEKIGKLCDDIPIGRLCQPEEVAKVAIFLADETLSPDYLTGSVITLDGGMGL